MKKLVPWHKVVTPRQDLRDGKPLDASEFAVHLDLVRRNEGPAVYRDPAAFFGRTFLTDSLKSLAAQVVRRLNGLTVETSPVFNFVTQFGGGKTHALTLLYHLARGGPAVVGWQGMPDILATAGVTAVPRAATAVFVGEKFDSLSGRGAPGEPTRYTPWGEIAWQLGGAAAFEVVREHDETRTAPGGDVVDAMIPKGQPTLILIDELMHYLSRTRNTGLAGQTYDFLQSLTELARGRDEMVVVVSIPKSVDEMTSDDEALYQKVQKLLDRLGKAMLLSAEGDICEIIRRRLFDWEGFPQEAEPVVAAYAEWVHAHRNGLPSSFPLDDPKRAFRASYPFHPAAISVFERKWQMVSGFQRTRGALRLLALWVSRAYHEAYQKDLGDALLMLGMAPLEDPQFRAAAFEQLKEEKLEPAVTTDIAGKADAHAVRLDKQGTVAIQKARVHRKVATVVFFESNGGQTRDPKGVATEAEIRLAVGEPGVDLMTIDNALTSLTENCYYLDGTRNRLRFVTQPNLNKVFADRRTNVAASDIADRIRAVVQKELAGSVLCAWFPERSGEVEDQPSLRFVVLAPERTRGMMETSQHMASLLKECGGQARKFVTGLLFIVAESVKPMQDEARKLLAWESIRDDAAGLKLKEAEVATVERNVRDATSTLRDSVWKAYRHVLYHAKDGTLGYVGVGTIVSGKGSLQAHLMDRLVTEDLVTKAVSPTRLVTCWPPAFVEWSTKDLRDAFYASPLLPRVTSVEVIKQAIASGVAAGQLGLAGSKVNGSYAWLRFGEALESMDVEVSETVYVIREDTAKAALSGSEEDDADDDDEDLSDGGDTDGEDSDGEDTGDGVTVEPPESEPQAAISLAQWTGVLPTQKWTQFYNRVLSRFAGRPGLSLSVTVSVSPDGGLSQQKVDEMQAALRDLGLEGPVHTE